jgi:hypothetical protein
MANLFEPPPIFTLPLSKGGDLYFGFIYKPLVVDEDGAPVLTGGGQRQYAVADYPDGATVALIIDNDDTTITVDADIAGPQATVWEDKAVADTVKGGKLWRVVLTFADGFDQVICNGKTVRKDGK